MTLVRRRLSGVRHGVPVIVVLGAGVLATAPAFLAAQDAPAARALVGDAARDLVFTPVPRCRVIDTRVAGARLSGGVPRHFDVAGPLAGQGGATDCLVPFGPAAVVVLNLVAVDPLGAGTVTAWPFGGDTPAANVISYDRRRGIGGAANAANEVSLAICDPVLRSDCSDDITLLANGADTHVVADVAGYYSPVTGLTVPWEAVTGMPAGFDDGTDDDTRYSAGTGLTMADTVFAVDTAAIQRRVSQTCAAGSSIRAIDAAGGVTCESDTGTTYSAGYGIAISGSTISVPSLGITGSMLAAGAVSAGKIAPNAVTYAEVADRSITTADIALASITNAELAPFAVGPGKIASGVVGQDQIAADGVSAIEIAPDAVGPSEIATNAVGSDEIAAGAVGRSEIDGTERAIYRMRAACHADGITTSATCETPLCSPFPVPLFWSCGNNCDSLAPVDCDNTLLGYLLSPNID